MQLKVHATSPCHEDDVQAPQCKIFSNLKCLYTNCDGLFNKSSEFNLRVNKEEPHIIFLTETKLHKEIINEEIFPTSKYEIYRIDRDSINIGGGVCILVSKDYVSRSRPDLIIEGCESVCCEVTLGTTNILLSCIYRPPSSLDDNNGIQFYTFFQLLLNRMTKPFDNLHSFLMGNTTRKLCRLSNSFVTLFKSS